MDINEYRRRVCDELTSLRQFLQDETELWFDDLPDHVQRLYGSASTCLQVPMLRTLCLEFGWKDSQLLNELETGFNLLGELTPGWGWQPRADNRYSSPLPMMDFFRLNEQYVRKKLRHHKTDPDWQILAKEIADDVLSGRMEGPFAGPPSWPKKTTALHSYQHTASLLPGPQQHVPTAVAFAIQQVGSDGNKKVRRGEDWRRGLHNATVQAGDSPPSHRADSFVAVARAIAASGMTPLLWGTDQESAYRQLPVANPGHTWVLLFTKQGQMFGATGSVWGYSRTADMMIYLNRAINFTPSMHYVDDFGTIEQEVLAESSFKTSHHLWEVVGFQFKKSKQQPPQPSHRMLGIVMTMDRDRFILAPDPPRVVRMTTQLKEILLQGELHPDDAMKLAGKLQFLTETLAGKAMQACLLPIYHHGNHYNGDAKISAAMRDCMETVIFLLENLQPKIIEFKTQLAAVIYADAYFEAGDRQIRLSEARQMAWDASASNLMVNGWGWVVSLPCGQKLFAYGRIPAKLLKKFTSRDAFIYILEIVAQILPLVTCRQWLPHHTWNWCDNEASKSALKKGHGKEARINNLLSMTWGYLTLAQLEPHWRRVTSAPMCQIKSQDTTWTEPSPRDGYKCQHSGTRSTTFC
eukprot:Skav222350  [mRNA]  locus=scaffold3497:166552:168456:+ [translate_table: standard]